MTLPTQKSFPLHDRHDEICRQLDIIKKMLPEGSMITFISRRNNVDLVDAIITEDEFDVVVDSLIAASEVEEALRAKNN